MHSSVIMFTLMIIWIALLVVRKKLSQKHLTG